MNADSRATAATLLRAILIENRNAAIYSSLAQLFQGYDKTVEAIFHEMAREEIQDGIVLRALYHDAFGLLPATSTEPIDATDLEDAAAFLSDSMTVDQALEAGLRAEAGTLEFYRREASRVSEPQLQQMYSQLAEFEQARARLLQQKLAERQLADGASAST